MKLFNIKANLRTLSALTLTGALVAGTPFTSAAQRADDKPKSDTVGSVDPTALLKCRSDNQAIFDEMLPHYQAVLKVLKEAEGKSDAEVARLNPKMVGEGRAGIEHMTRTARRLKLLGDPLGDDVQARALAALPPVTRVVTEIVRANTDKIAKSFPRLQKAAEAKEKAVKAAVEKQAAAGNWEEAEKVLFDAFDELWVDAAFVLDANQFNVVFSRFAEHEIAINRKLPDFIQRKAQAKSSEAYAAYLGAVKDLLAKLDSAATQVGTSGATDASGESLPGPEAFAKLAEEWGKVQALATIARGRAWTVLTGPRGQIELVDVEQKTKQNSAKIAEALAKIIAKDAARLSAGEAAKRYSAYLQSVAPSVARSNEPSYQPAIAKALDAVTAKDPALAKLAGGYNLATGDLLRWRRRASEAQAAALRKDYAPLPAKYLEASKAAYDKLGYFRPGTSAAGEAAVSGSLADAVNACWPHLKELKVSGKNLQAANTEATTWANCDQRTLVQTPDGAIDVAPAQKALKSLLLLNNSQTPLGLDAAVAAWRADQGVWVEIGGAIEEFKLYGLSSMWVDSTADPALLLTLGPPSAEKSVVNFQSDLVSVFQVAPAWIMGDGYLVSKGK